MVIVTTVTLLKEGGMDRREFLATLGSAVGCGVGAYGLYSAIHDGTGNATVRGGRTDTPERSPGGAAITEGSPTARATELPQGETRSGALLSGMSPASSRRSYLDAVSAWLGRRQAVMALYLDIGISNHHIEMALSRAERLWRLGHVPMLFLQPYFGSAETTADTVASDVAAGAHDDRLRAWARALSDWAMRPEGEPDRRVYLNLAPELNGDWVPWGIPTPKTSPESYVRMWRHIHSVVMDTPLQSDHVQWVWSVNNTSGGKVDVAECYPGDEYADWVSITGYNWRKWGGWMTPKQNFGGMLKRIRSFTDQPVAFGEFGASADCADGHCPERKDEWITDVYDYAVANDVRMACWFDHWVEKDRTDWGVFDTEFGTDRFRYLGETYKVYGNYRDVIRRDVVLPTHPVDARRLTGAEFNGSFTEE